MSSYDFQISMEKTVVKFTLHGVPDRPGMAADILNRLNLVGVNVVLVVQTAGGKSVTELALAVVKEDVEKTYDQLKLMHDVLQEDDIEKEESVALVTLEMKDLSKTPGMAARMFRTLAERRINIDLISTSLHTITCLIAEERADEALAVLQQEFHPEPE